MPTKDQHRPNEGNLQLGQRYFANVGPTFVYGRPNQLHHCRPKLIVVPIWAFIHWANIVLQKLVIHLLWSSQPPAPLPTKTERWSNVDFHLLGQRCFPNVGHTLAYG